jgi:hypothetical protein
MILGLPNANVPLTFGEGFAARDWWRFFFNVANSSPVARPVSAAEIASAAGAVNTQNKQQGLVVFDTTNNRLMVATGSTAVSPWYVADGSASVTPS